MSRNTTPKAGATVTVASKLPHGIILRRFVMRETQELVMGGGTRPKTEAIDTGERFAITGVAREPGKMPSMRNHGGAPVAGSVADVTDTGFALTHGVPKDLWDSWLEANKDTPMVQNGLIFAHGQLSSVKSMGKENEAQRSGLEPIDPNKPSPGIETADEMKGRKAA